MDAGEFGEHSHSVHICYRELDGLLRLRLRYRKNVLHM